MINKLHSLLNSPERGWDPVPSGHAEKYAADEWSLMRENVVDLLESRLGGLEGKRVLDLGGGPGHYSTAFAKRGARVTWHDVSRNYLDIVRRRAGEAGIDLEYSLGYLEDARRFHSRPFDLVFCRICWYYCMNDRGFADIFYRLVKPGGAGYIDTTTTAFHPARGLRRFQHALNDVFGIKVGHPNPPHGRVAALLQRYPLRHVLLDYSSPVTDRIFFVREGGG